MKLKQLFFTLTVMLSCFVVSVNAQNVAKIGNTEYATIAAALEAADAGATITFVADVTEDVTISKAITIDGVGHTCTGKMINGSNTITVQNVNFIKGFIDANNSAQSRELTIKDCSFDGVDKSIGYAMTVRHGKSVTIENCSAKNYKTGMLYIPQNVATILVKDVTVENVAAAFNISYSGNGAFENISLNNVTYGLHVQNYGSRIFTLKNCIFNSKYPIYVQNKGTAIVSFEFEGTENKFITETEYKSQYAKLVLKNNASLIAPELFTIISETEEYEVKYENGTYSSVEKANDVVIIGEQGYKTLADALAAATAGQTITFVADVTEDVTISKAVTIDGAGKTYTGAMSLKADATIKNLNFDGKGYNGYAITTRGAQYLTIEDCTAKNYGYGFVQLASATALTTVKNVTVSNMNYGVKVDYSNAVVLENADITAAVAAVLNSNYGGKTITIKDSKLSILGTWTRNNTIKTTYVFEGANTISQFIIDAAIDNFKLAANATLTAPEGFNVTTVDGYEVKYENGIYSSVEKANGGTWGGIDWTLTHEGTLTIAPTKGTPGTDNSGKWSYEVGQWPEAVRYNSNGVGVAVEGWPYDKSKVKTLVIEEGVTSIGSFTAQGFTNLEGEVVIPYTVKYIGQEAFQKSTFSKITFAPVPEGKTGEELCIAQGALKNLVIEEITFPEDRPVHLHAWMFANSNNLKHVTLPATIKSINGTTHVDYNHNPNQTNGGGANTSDILGKCPAVETITFGSQEVRDLYYNPGWTRTDAPIVVNVGLKSYRDFRAGIDAAKDGETVLLLGNVTLDDTWTIPAGMNLTLNLNGKTISQEKACTASYAMISNKGNLTIKGNGKISFTDTGAGDPAFGWGSYTVRNEGNLVVENGTIEHKGAQSFATHCIMAIYQYSGSTTINGGKISTPNYRSARLWKGDMTINGGTFDGQVWVQAVDNTAKLTINGGTFEPNGNDASSVFVTNNQYDVQLAVTDGAFNGKVGCSDAAKLAGVITGGKFTETAKNGTNVALLGDGVIFGDVPVEVYYNIIPGLKGNGTVDAPYLIRTIKELELFRASVNNGETKYNAPGVWVALDADIDMTSVNWVGIGTVTAEHGFMGNFDGKNFKIKNLTIDNPALDSDGYAYAGLFGVTEGTDKDNQNTIKNLTIENVTINTTGHIAAAAIAYPYYTIVDNVKVCGNIAINGGNYTAGVLAYTRRCVNASNLSIVCKEGSFVKGNQTVGGVISDIQMNGGLTAVYSNFSAEGITVTGEKSVGGISGIIATQTLNGATVKNVTLNSADAFAGVVAGRLGGTSTISNVVSENVTGATAVIGATYDGAKAVEARIGDTYYSSFTDAYTAANAGETVTLLADLNATEVILLGKSLTINGNGHKVTSNATRVFRVTTSNTEITLNDVNMVSTAVRVGTNDVRGISIDIIDNVKLTLNNCSVDFTDASANDWAYAVNVTGGSGHVVIVNGGTYEGANVINVRGANGTVTVKGATLTSTYPNHPQYYGACIYVLQNQNTSVNATENTFNGDNAIAFNLGAGNSLTESNNIDNTKMVVAMIGDAYYTSIQAAVEAAQANAVITLIADATGAGVVINKDVTIDFNNKTYTVNKTVGSTGTTTLGFQILKGNNVTLKNGTLKSTKTVEDSKEVKMLVQNYANLTVENMNLVDETEHILYVLSNNCGNTVVKGNTTITTDAVAFDSYYSKNYTAPTVTVETIGTISGKIEKNEGATIAIKGGTYTVDVTEWCAKGYKATKNAEGKYTVAVDPTYGKVAKVGENYYTTLREAVEAAPANATVELLEDVTLKGGYEDTTEGLRIEKAMTFEGNGHTINCGNFAKGIRIYGPSNLTDMKINNVTIVNNNVNGRCVDTRSGYLRLKFNNAHLIATNGNSQPLTVGGSEKLHQIDLSYCTIDAGESGYGIISFVPVNQAIKLMNTDVTGFAGIYLKGDGTKVTITTNSNVIGKNIHSGETNGFGAVVFEGNNNVVNINATSPMLKAIAEGGAEQAAILVVSGSNNKVVFETNKKAEVLAEGANSYWAMVSAEAANTSITKDGVAVELVAQCDDYQFISFEDAMRFAKDGSTVKLLADVNYTTANYVTDCDGYASIINIEGRTLTLDLNGKTINVDANAADLINAKGNMLMAVLSTDEEGHLILTDSSENKAGIVKVNANDATVYSLVTNYEEGCTVTINGGNYIADKLGDSMLYSGVNEGITVNDGNFNLGNVGTGSNGKPWIFNVLSSNEGHSTVNGGTFNTDVNHQFWGFEVKVPNTLALKDNGNGTWTVVNAVAYVAEIWKKWDREVGYATLEEAISAVSEYNCTDNAVTLVSNLTITQPIAIATKVVLNLNGKTIEGTDNATASYGLINIKSGADLTINGEGAIKLTATNNRGWNAYSSVISSQRGKLTVNGGTIEHLGGTDMAYAIDNLTNGKGTKAETVINGGTIKSTYRAIRQFLNGTEAENILTVNDGVIEGANKSIWMQDPSKNANTGTLYVAEDAELKGDVYLTVTAGSTEWPVEVEIAKAALVGTSTVLSSNVPEGYAVSEYPTAWIVEALNLADLTIVDGDYSEYINVTEKNVGRLTYERNFENADWQTLYLPFEVPYANLKNQFDVAYIYNAAYKEGEIIVDQVILDEDDANFVLAANYPYLIKAKETGYKEIVVDSAMLMITDVDTINCSSVFETFSFIGNYATIAVDTLDATKGYFELNGNWNRMDELNPFRVYMQIEMRNGEDFEYPTVPVRMRRVDENGNVDINDLNGEEMEGQEGKEDMIFDLNGRRISEPVKGFIYIINGQKVLY